MAKYWIGVVVGFINTELAGANINSTIQFILMFLVFLIPALIIKGK